MKALFLLGWTVFLVTLINATILCQSGSEPDIKTKTISIHMPHAQFGKVMEKLIENFDIPLGLELSANSKDMLKYYFEPNFRYVVTDENGTPSRWNGDLTFSDKNGWISVNLTDAALSDVFDQIVGQMPGYKWEIIDGVVNIFPTTSRDALLEKLLSTNVAKFNVAKPASIKMVEAKLFDLPEFSSFLASNNVCSYHFDSNAVFGDRVLPETMLFKDLTFRELLNKITKAKRGGWILRGSRIGASEGQRCISIQI